jgi:hypothetical protein
MARKVFRQISASLLGIVLAIQPSCSSSQQTRKATDAAEAKAPGCTYRGVTYEVGVLIEEPEDCFCMCQPEGFISCPAMCGRADQSCYYGGSSFASGTSFPAADGCNVCVCKNGNASCPNRICLDGGTVDVADNETAG